MPENIIEVSHLSKSYGDLKAVDDLSFSVKEGEIFALLGPNGAGKTTTVEIIEGLRKADSGSVKVKSFDPWKQLENLRMIIGVMPQNFEFFEKIKPSEAVSFYADLFARKIDSDFMLKMVQLQDSRNSMFENLSGGQKQKLGLLLSMVNDPEILFLDEPTSGLDPSARRSIWRIIHELKRRGKTIILTTHYMEEAEALADRIAFINYGQMVAIGTLEDIISKYGTGQRVIMKAGKDLVSLLQDKGFETQNEGEFVEVIMDTRYTLTDIIGAIEGSGMKFTQMSVRNDTLEDIFVRLVGRMEEGIIT